MKKLLKTNVFFYIVVSLGAIVIFIGTYGYKLIDPTYIELCYIRGDLTQHYFGWVGFRNSDWQFPLGLYDNNTYPDNTSIIFTDSIPIVAIIFKCIRTILPVKFQYFGLFTLGCYIAQAVIAAKITKKYCNNKIYAFIVSLLFSFVPIVLHRTFGHEALSATFLILLMAENILFLKDEELRTIYIRVAVCSILSAGIHMYFVLICGIILVGVVIGVVFQKNIYTQY